MPNRDKILITVVALVSLAIIFSQNHGVIAAGGISSELGSFDRSFTVAAPAQLNIENSSGSVNIRRGVTDKVEVHGVVSGHSWFGDLRDQAEKIIKDPPVEQNGNTVRIHRPEPHDWFNNISIRYDITVPEETTVNSRTGSGSQTVANVKGPVTLHSGSGSVTVTGVGAETDASTGSGSITLQDVNGPVKVQTGSGSVRADGIAGAFRGHTGSGSIDLRQTASGDVDAQTGSGHIKLENIFGALKARAGSGSIRIDGRPANEWTVHSGSGSIDLRIAGDAGLDLYARTSFGRVDVGVPITLEAGTMNKREVRGKIRGGGARVEATTGSGTIHVE